MTHFFLHFLSVVKKFVIRKLNIDLMTRESKQTNKIANQIMSFYLEIISFQENNCRKTIRQVNRRRRAT